jgi:peptide/nickel transport system substrate-binding protein
MTAGTGGSTRRRGVLRGRQLSRFASACLVMSGIAAGVTGWGQGAVGAATSSSRDGTLNIGYDFSSEFSNTFDPAKSQSECDSIVTEQIYGFLLTRNAQDQVQPGLAQSWSLGPDSLTLDLRPGLTFSDGEPYDANAVKEGLLHNKSNTMFTELHAITSIDVLSPTSLRINLSDNSGVRLTYALTQSSGEIPAPSTLNSNFSSPVGAGPFQFVSYREGSNLELKRNGTYYDAAAYHLGGVNFIQVGAGPPSVLALRSGSVDMIRVEPDSYSEVAGNSGIATASRPSTDYLQLTFRYSGPLLNTKVRQAINLAINRQQVNQVVLDGRGLVATQPFPPFSPVYVRGLVGSNHYDPAEAKKLLAQAGYPNGFSFTVLLPGGGISLEERLAALVQADLGAVGIKTNVQRELGSDLYTAFLVQKQGNGLLAENTDNPYPPLLLGQFASNDFAAQQLNAVNPTVNAILQRADDSTSLATIDALGQQGNKVDVDQALEVPIAFLPQIVAWNRATVGGDVHAPFNTCAPDDLAGVTVKG